MKEKLKRIYRRAFTVFIVPHDGEEPRSFKIPMWVFQGAGVLVLTFVSAFLIISYSAGDLRNRTDELNQVLREERSEQEDLLEELRTQEEEFVEDKRSKEEKIDEITRETEKIIHEMEEIRGLRDTVYDKVDGIDPPDDDSTETSSVDHSFSHDDDSATFEFSSSSEDDPSLEYQVAGDDPSEDSDSAELENLVNNDSLSLEERVSLSRGGQVSQESAETKLEEAENNLQALQSSFAAEKESLENLISELDEHNSRMRTTPSIRPAQGNVISGFGNRNDPITGGTRFHSGVDIANSHGTPIYATAYGRVSYAGYRGGYGNKILIEHGYGYQTCYAHMTSFAVSEGQQVSRGQVIGYMGRTGRAVGTHVHYEVRVNGSAVNPASYF